MQKYVLSILAMTMVGLSGCQTTSGFNPSNSSHIKSASSVAEAQARPNQINFRKIKQTENRPVIALVLGSGGARGYAHIGAIEVLEQAGIQPDFIVGTSAGSIVGSIYASGKPAIELRNIALSMKALTSATSSWTVKAFLMAKKLKIM
jgi:Predicted esterase of the alpha-beta hydrolase superfamily